MSFGLNLPPADGDPLDLNEEPLLEDEQASAQGDVQAAAQEDEQAAVHEDVQAAAQEDEQAAAQKDEQAATMEDAQAAAQEVCHHFDLNIPISEEHQEIYGGNHVLHA
jgi:hypothetical protein